MVIFSTSESYPTFQMCQMFLKIVSPASELIWSPRYHLNCYFHSAVIGLRNFRFSLLCPNRSEVQNLWALFKIVELLFCILLMCLSSQQILCSISLHSRFKNNFCISVKIQAQVHFAFTVPILWYLFSLTCNTYVCSITTIFLELAKFWSVLSFEAGSSNCLCVLEVCGQLMRPAPPPHSTDTHNKLNEFWTAWLNSYSPLYKLTVAGHYFHYSLQREPGLIRARYFLSLH